MYRSQVIAPKQINAENTSCSQSNLQNAKIQIYVCVNYKYFAVNISNLLGGFTYKVSETSTITSVSPSRGGTGGGVVVTLQGTNFGTSEFRPH